METPRSSRAIAPRFGGGLPLIGHLAQMRRDPLATLRGTAQLGDVARLDFGPRGEAYLVTHPDGVKRIMLDAQSNYTKQTRGFETLRAFVGTVEPPIGCERRFPGCG